MEQKQKLFMEAYASCEDKFTRYCQALTYGKMDSDDFIQDILLSTYQNFDNTQHKEQLLHYLIRAAKYKSIDKLRKNKYQTESLDQHQETLRYQGADIELNLDTQLMYQALAQLPIKQREAVILHEISGFSMKEIAQIQGSNTNAIKNKVSRGRKKLAVILNDEKSRKSPFLLLFALLNPNIFKAKFAKYKTQFIQNILPQTPQILTFTLAFCSILAVASLLIFQNKPAQKHLISNPEKAQITRKLPLKEELSATNIDIETSKEAFIENQAKSIHLNSSFGDKTPPQIVLETPQIEASLPKSIDSKLPFINPNIFPKTLPLLSQNERLKPSKSLGKSNFRKKKNKANTQKVKSSTSSKITLKRFKKELLKHLKQDGFISKNKEDILLWVQDRKIVINHQ